MPDIRIRRMTMADVEPVAALEKATFRTPWPEEAYICEMGNVAARYLVAEADGHIVGYAGGWLMLDESHITKVAVREDLRGRGLGRQLMCALMQYLSNLGADYMALEVRRSNLAAQELYKSLGFINLGPKKRYYEDNGEDAFFMVCTQMPAADPDFEEEETVSE